MSCRTCFFCMLFASLAWAQAKPNGSGQDDGKHAAETNAASISMNAPVLTIKGFCPEKSGVEVTDAKSCVTVITRGQFEELAAAVRPNLSASVKQQLASIYPRLLVMAQKAQDLGLDRQPPYEQMIAFSRMQILAQGLIRKLEQGSDVTEQEVEDYYSKHGEDFDEYSFERIFVPLRKQAGPGEGKSQSAADMRTSQMELTELAESLRNRAVAGADFMDLQKEAYAAAGVKMASLSTTTGKLRRTGLPANDAEVFELKVGEVSNLITDAGGHYIYKLAAKDRIPLDAAKSEILRTVQSQRAQAELEKINHSYTAETNDAYFGVHAAKNGD
jgi:hypothetical protein